MFLVLYELQNTINTILLRLRLGAEAARNNSIDYSGNVPSKKLGDVS